MANGRLMITPKGPRVKPATHATADFDRQRALDYLFSLPLPPRVTRGKPYPIDTPLGRVMWLKGQTLRRISGIEGCPNVRVMSDYLANRVPIRPHHRAALARELGVDARIL